MGEMTEPVQLSQRQMVHKFGETVTCLAVSVDGGFFAAGGLPKTCVVYSVGGLAGGSPIATFTLSSGMATRPDRIGET